MSAVANVTGMDFATAIGRPEVNAKLSGPLRTALSGLLKRPIIGRKGRKENRLRSLEARVINHLENNGHAARVKAARRADGSIDWAKLLDLLAKLLPIILALFM